MKNFFTKPHRLRGFGLLETLLSITILAIVSTLVATVLIDVNRSNLASQNTVKANQILTESTEAIRSIRDQNFLYLENGSYGLQESNSAWSFSGTEDVVDSLFTRRVIISDVYRNGSGDIDDAGSNLDDRIKRVSIEIEWNTPIEGNKMISTDLLISDWEAQETISSSESEWANGTFIQTTTTGSGNGALILDSFVGSWETSFNSASYIFDNNANGNAIKVRNSIGYLVGDLNGGINNFNIIDVSNPSTVTIMGSLLLDDNANDIALGTNYAYIATSNQNKELITVNISDPYNPSIIQEKDVAGTKNAISITIDGDVLYVGMESNTNEEWHIFSIQDPANPTLLTSLEMGADINEMEIVNGIAYLAADGIDALQVYDVSNPASPSLLGSLSVNSENSGKGLDVSGNTLYLVTGKSNAGAEFFIIDVSTPASPSLVSSLEINTDIQDVESFSTDAFISTVKIGAEFQVIDISNPGSPSVTDVIDLGANGNKIHTDQQAIYVTSDDNTSALFILSRPVEQFFGNGSFQSQAFDSGSDTTQWLTFNWEGEIPPNTTVEFQMKFADSEANLSSAEWSGPDGTSASTYTANSNVINVPGAASGSRWMQYQVAMTSDGEFTPEVTAIRIQYAP